LASQAQGSPVNYYTTLNAANPENETAGIVGTSNTTGAAGVIISSTTTTPAPTNGTYALKLERRNGAGAADMYIAIGTLEIGTEYTITLDAVELVTQNEFNVDLASTEWEVYTPSSINSLSWTTLTIVGTPTVTNPSLRLVGSSVALGDAAAIDNIRVNKTSDL